MALVFPIAAAAQTTIGVSAGLASTGASEPYAEIVAGLERPLSGGPFTVGASFSHQRKMWTVDYGPVLLCGNGLPLEDDGFWGVPASVDNWTSLTADVGLRLAGDRFAFHVSGGPVAVLADLGGGRGETDYKIGAGVAGEIGVLEVRVARSVGIGLSVHGGAATTHTWGGVRLGVGVAL